MRSASDFEPRRWRPDIQGLRAVAVLLVVAYHAGVPGTGGGYVGVDVFFVISGFLITGQLVRVWERDGRVNFSGFYAGRVRRLLPSAAVVVIATLIVGRLVLSPFAIRSLIKDGLAAALYVINYRFAFQGTVYQEFATAPSALQHLWSLSVEEQFYIIWPALIAVCGFAGRRAKSCFVAALALGGGVSLALSITMTPGDPSMSYFSLQTRAWEFCVGAGIALAVPWLSRLPRQAAAPLSWLGLAGIVVAGTQFDISTPFPGVAALLPVLAAAAVIAGGCRADANLHSGAERLLGRRPAQWLGKLSYQWYLWHWPMIILAPDVLGRTLGWHALAAVSLLALMIAAVVHYTIEQPVRASRLRRGSLLGGGLVAAVGATVAVLAISLPSLAIGSNRTVTDVATAKTLPGLLVAGLKVQKVPGNVTPRLSDAANDNPISTLDGSNCYAQPLVVKQPSCVYGDPNGKTTIVLVGDSHAQQWLPAMIQYAKEHKLKIVSWTKSACSLADVQEYNTTLHREYSECDQWRSITIPRILRLHPSLVVVSQSDNIPGPTVSSATWAAATAKMMSLFKDHGIKSVYILDTPLAGSIVPTCLAEHLDDVHKCERKNNSHDYGYPSRIPAIKAALAKSQIPTIDPRKWLCTPVACPVIVHDIIVYRDLTHLTATFSKFLTPLMAEVLKAGGLPDAPASVS